MKQVDNNILKRAPAPLAPLQLVIESLGAIPIAVTAALYSVSFAVIVYGGPLSSHLDRGIFLTLLGSAVAAITTGLFGSLRGAISHAQDATALLLAGTIAPLVVGLSTSATPEVQFATAVALVATTTFITGVLIYLSGVFRMSFTARYIPYPVISGLLVSIGYLLSMGSINLVIQQPVDLFNLVGFLSDGSMMPWFPWALGAVLMVIARRWLAQNRVLPLGLILGLVTFFLISSLAGISLADAEAAGLLLGPFPEQRQLATLSPAILGDVDWARVIGALTVVAALVPLTIVSGILNIQGIAQVTGEDIDLDKDLKAIGLANITGGAVGGLVSYPAVSTSLLGRHLRVSAVVAWGATGLICCAVAFYGTHLLGLLPRGLFAMVVLYLGLSILLDVLVSDARRLQFRDFAPVLIILATTAFLGVFPALFVGIIISTAIFIVSYARLPFLRADTALAVRRSIVERAEPNHAILNSEGKKVRVLELAGSLFFGTAYAMRQHVRGMISEDPDSIHTIIIDFRTVRDMDASAAFSLERTLSDCTARGIEVCLSGLRPGVEKRLRRFASTRTDTTSPLPRVFDMLDSALQAIEAEVLERYYSSHNAEPPQLTFLEELALAVPNMDLADVFPIITVADGQPVVTQHASSNEIYVLMEGKAVAEIEVPGGAPLLVARFEPGALVGEMAFYMDSKRTATVHANGEARLMRIDPTRLSADGDLPEKLASAFHLIAAKHLSRRLAVANQLMRSAFA